jgi:hypothetical protein
VFEKNHYRTISVSEQLVSGSSVWEDFGIGTNRCQNHSASDKFDIGIIQYRKTSVSEIKTVSENIGIGSSVSEQFGAR